MHYYQRHIGDYTKDTGHLTLLEHGVYNVLLDWAYASEKALPEDSEAIYRLCRALHEDERKAVDSVVQQFFPRRRNKRAQQEIRNWRVKSRNNTKSAAIRWESKRNANASPTHCEGGTTRARVPPTMNHQPKSEERERVAAQTKQFAAAQARRRELEAVGEEERTSEEQVELKKIRGLIQAIQKKQRAGDFTPVLEDEL